MPSRCAAGSRGRICSPSSTTRSCPTPRATPTSCCPPRPISRARTSCARTARTTRSSCTRCVPPRGEAWSNRRLAQELAQRLGLTDPVFSMGTDELVAPALRRRDRDGGRRRSRPRCARPAPSSWPRRRAQRFTTPSGKLEFYSETLGGRACRRCRTGCPIPWARTTAPLAAAPSHRAGLFPGHTAFSGIAALRRREGPPACVLHPDEAAARGLSDGDAVRAGERPRLGAIRAARERRGVARRGLRARPAPLRRGHRRHDQYAVLRPLQRPGRGRHLPGHAARCPRGGAGPAAVAGPAAAAAR